MFFRLKKMCLVLILVALSCFKSSLAQDAQRLIQNYDIRFYHPVEHGLKDLAFEVRYEGLKETIEERLGLDNLVDVYFQVYWMMPNQFLIRVAGLPDGFEELRAELRAMLSARLELVIPEKLASKIEGYQLRVNSIQGGSQVVGADPSHNKAINEIHFNFDNDGRLTRVRTQSPMGTNTSNIKMSPKSWSENKWVVDEIEVRTVQGIQMTTIDKNITYNNVEGFGLPQKVQMNTVQKLVRPESDDGDTFESSSELVINFSNYRVNKGVARRAMTSE